MIVTILKKFHKKHLKLNLKYKNENIFKRQLVPNYLNFHLKNWLSSTLGHRTEKIVLIFKKYRF